MRWQPTLARLNIGTALRWIKPFQRVKEVVVFFASAGFQKRDERPADPCIRGKGWQYHLF